MTLLKIEQIEWCSELFVPVVYRLKNFFWTFVLRWVDLKNYIGIFICLKIDLVKKIVEKPCSRKFRVGEFWVTQGLSDSDFWHLPSFGSLNGCKTVGEFWHLASFGSLKGCWTLGGICHLVSDDIDIVRHLHLANVHLAGNVHLADLYTWQKCIPRQLWRSRYPLYTEVPNKNKTCEKQSKFLHFQL